jgi:hypothetical protein
MAPCRRSCSSSAGRRSILVWCSHVHAYSMRASLPTQRCHLAPDHWKLTRVYRRIRVLRRILGFLRCCIPWEYEREEFLEKNRISNTSTVSPGTCPTCDYAHSRASGTATVTYHPNLALLLPPTTANNPQDRQLYACPARSFFPSNGFITEYAIRTTSTGFFLEFGGVWCVSSTCIGDGLWSSHVPVPSPGTSSTRRRKLACHRMEVGNQLGLRPKWWPVYIALRSAQLSRPINTESIPCRITPE